MENEKTDNVISKTSEKSVCCGRHRLIISLVVVILAAGVFMAGLAFGHELGNRGERRDGGRQGKYGCMGKTFFRTGGAAKNSTE